jgi:aspartyl-tRNA(Asn)/glutamyl-tRNA(Gln) amidotransferase subunit C
MLGFAAMRIRAETVRQMAALAALELDDTEVERMRGDLDAILGYVAALDELDTRDVEPTTHALELTASLRDDEVRGVLSVAEVVRNAPEHTSHAMVVPKVLE